MKKLICTLLFLVSAIAQAQTNITNNYTVYAYYNQDSSNEKEKYVWLYDGEQYLMNFPQTISGLQNLKDKVEFIALLSGLRQPSEDVSIVPEQYRHVIDTSVVHSLIMDERMAVSTMYILGNKILRLNASKYHYYLSISDRD